MKTKEWIILIAVIIVVAVIASLITGNLTGKITGYATSSSRVGVRIAEGQLKNVNVNGYSHFIQVIKINKDSVELSFANDEKATLPFQGNEYRTQKGMDVIVEKINYKEGSNKNSVVLGVYDIKTTLDMIFDKLDGIQLTEKFEMSDSTDLNYLKIKRGSSCIDLCSLYKALCILGFWYKVETTSEGYTSYDLLEPTSCAGPIENYGKEYRIQCACISK